MRLVSFGPPHREQPGLIDGDRVVPLSAILKSPPATLRQLLADHGLDALAKQVAKRHATGSLGKLPGEPLASVRLGPPITDPSKIICIGLNYQDHAKEQDAPWPEQPLLFAKAPSSLIGCHDPIIIPAKDCGPDYEVELVVVIGQRCRHVAERSAWDLIAGLCVGNDVTARKWQKGDGQWFRAKSSDTFFPCGPWLTTLDEVPSVPDLRLTTEIGGAILQDATANLLIHDVPAIIAHITRTMTLEPGDLISTGTPAGVGCYRTPRRWLTPGEVVTCRIASGAVDLGALGNVVQAG